MYHNRLKRSGHVALAVLGLVTAVALILVGGTQLSDPSDEQQLHAGSNRGPFFRVGQWRGSGEVTFSPVLVT